MPKKSIIRTDKIYTLSKDIIIKKFNVLNNETFSKVTENIRKIIE